MKSLQNFKFDFLKNEFSTGFKIEIPFPKPCTFVYIYLFIYLFIYLNLGPVLQIVQRPLKIFAHVYIYQLTKFGYLMSRGSKDIFKNAPCIMY